MVEFKNIVCYTIQARTVGISEFKISITKFVANFTNRKSKLGHCIPKIAKNPL